ncbi:Tfp pilus assembly protein PilE [Clostridium moniliforme]|uniref:Tfp pilus assembly protein PilE n=1 Tax=Clostridium moniliforme TaxID=39489 RepID=A0ABS4F0G4_9CLOT|nr:prepilin-type N-terminal cleavage/methylation domain-containing protein [Clostridium moniliforme]MBP1889743.1 Tfp pilus assembly protein PilE [Clostridium moniliforme]
MDGRKIKKLRKGGFTLIECIAYIFISTIILTIITTITIDGYKHFIRRGEFINREDEIDNAILSIRKIFNDVNNTDYIIKNNKIEIIKEEQGIEEVNNKNNINKDLNVKSKEFEVISGNLYVKYYSYNEYENKRKHETSNIILENVENFNAFKKKNLIYVDLIVDGREFLICL